MSTDGWGSDQGERLLAQRSVGWKLACSSWVVLVAVGFVMFSVLGWVLGAVLSRSRRMWLWTLMWGLLYVVAVVAIELDVVLVFLAIWVASIGHAGYLARGVLRTRAVALARDQHWRASAAGAAQPQQPAMPTIPLPDGVAPMRGTPSDSAPPTLPRG